MSFASWSVLTVDFLVVLHLALGGVTLAALLHLVNANGGSRSAISAFVLCPVPLAFCLLLILLLNGRAPFPGSVRPADAGLEQLWVSRGRELVGFGVVGVLYGCS